MVPERVGCWHAEYLLIWAFLIPHLEQANGFGLDDASREGGFPHQDQGIQGVAVRGQSVQDESVIAGVVYRRKEHPVKPERLSFHVILVLVPASLGDLYHYVNSQFFWVRVHKCFLRLHP